MAAVLKSNTQEHLHNQVANKAYVLYEALAIVTDSKMTSAALHQVVEQCQHYIQDIEQAAEQAHLSGLREVCALAQKYLQDLNTDDEEKRRAVCLKIEQLPRLLSNYLHTPTDNDSCDKLLFHFQNSIWDSPLDLSQVTLLSQQLLADFVAVEVDNNETSDFEQLAETEEAVDLTAESPAMSEAIYAAPINEDTAHVLFDDLGATDELPAELETSLLDVGGDEDALLPSDELNDDAQQPIDAQALMNDFAALGSIEDNAFALEKAMDVEEITPDDTVVLPAFDELSEEPVAVEHTGEASTPNNSDSNLHALSLQVETLQADLAKELDAFVVAEDNSDELLNGIEGYTNTVQRLWEIAEANQLKGLQDVCTFVNENMFELCSESQVTREEKSTLFSACPALIIDYLHAPQENASALVEHLQDSGWAEPLSTVKANTMLVQLVKERVNEVKIHPIEHNEKPANISTVTEINNADLTEQAVADDTLDDIGLVVTDIAEPAQDNSRHWENAFIADDVLLASEANEKAEILLSSDDELLAESDLAEEALDDVAEMADELAELEETEALLSSDDELLAESDLAEEALDDVAEMADELAELEETEALLSSDDEPLAESDLAEEALDDVAETADELAELEETEALLSSDDEPLADDLVEEALDDVAEMADELVELEDAEALLSSDDEPLAESDLAEEALDDVAEMADELAELEDAEALLSSDDEPLADDLAEEALDDVAEMADELVELADAEALLSSDDEPLAESDLAEEALDDVAEMADELAELEDAEALLSSDDEPLADDLVEEALDDVAEMANEPVELEDAEALLSSDDEPLADDLAEEALDDVAEMANEPVELEDAEALLSSDDEPLAGNDLAKGTLGIVANAMGDIKLADTDTLELIDIEIGEAQLALNAELNKFVTAEDGSNELFEAVGQYSDHVQSIYEMAGAANLKGVQSVCEFVNENLVDLSTHGKAIRHAAQPALMQWSTLVQSYLKSPHDGANLLVEHLSLPSWTDGLDSAQKQKLLAELLPERTNDDTTAVSDTDTIAEVTPDYLESHENDVPPEQEEITLASPEIIELLVGQVIDTQEALEPVMDTLTTAEDESEAALEAVETYNEHMQGIWDAADMAGLQGVQQICEFANNNIMAFSMLPQAERVAARPLFDALPEQLVTYLQTPRAGTQSLLAHLQNTQWTTPLDSEQITELEVQLLPAVDAARTDDESAATEEEIVLASADVLELLSGQIGDTETLLQPLIEVLNTAEEDSEDLMEAVEAYPENMQAIWEAAEMAGLEGLQDVCTAANDNVMALAMQPTSERQAGVALLADLPLHMQTYLISPKEGAKTLITQLQSEQLSMPLDAEQGEALYNKLVTPAVGDSVAESETAAVNTLIDPDTLELIKAQIIDSNDGLSAALKECIAMENDNPALLEAIENYTEQVQAIYEAAEMAGLEGLQDVCNFVNENITEMGIAESDAKQAMQPQFEQWPQMVLAYLNSPSEGAANLTAFMCDESWPQPLDAERAETLQAMLLQGSSSPEQQAEQAAEAEIDYAEPEEEVAGEPVAELNVDVDADGDISLGNMEVLGILVEELESSKEEMDAELAKFVSLDNGEEGFDEAAENYGDHVMRLYAASEMMGLEGLQEICTFLTENVTGLAEKGLPARKKAKARLESWPQLILNYLNNPADNIVPLINHFRENEWTSPMPDQIAHDLAYKLAQGSTVEEDEEEAAQYARQKEASAEDVSLALPEDINAELYEAYLQEVPQHASEFAECLQNIIEDSTQVSEIERAQRVAHTLKGSSRIIGINGVANMGHHLEDILEYLAQKQVSPPKELTDTMIEASDCIEMMVDYLTGQDDPPENAQQVLQSVLDWANKIDKGDLSAPPAPRPTPTASDSAESTDKPAEAKKEKKEKKAAAPEASPEQMLRVPTKTIDDLMRLVGELSISMGQMQEKLRHVMQNTRGMMDQGIVLHQKTFELENLVDVRGITGVDSKDRLRLNADGFDAEEQGEDFDPLEFEEYNELHSVAHSFIESIADSREIGSTIHDDLAELETMFVQQQRLNKEFQASIMTTRTVPVATIVSKLQRNIRQTCRMTGKKAELEIDGADLLVDSDVLNSLGDPLMHILRNSVDHGIENADERAIMGKPETGTVKLSFYREGNNIVVSCKDDGQGLNYTNIRYTAIQRGLITENQEMSDQELGRLILMPSFSTKSGVTQVSGRGVGMDVVHTNIRQMKGTLDLVSETGKGTTLLIKLPMSLVTVHVLIVRIGYARFGIPTTQLEQALAPGLGEFQQVGNEMTLKMGKSIYSIKSLSDLLNIPGDDWDEGDLDKRSVVLVHSETGITAVFVDELLDTHDLVMKTMGKYVQKIYGVSGAAILGDGSLVPLLDVPELLRSPMQAAMSSYVAEQGEGAEIPAGVGVPNIMIVDDSLSVRKSLSLLIEDAGFEALLAKDGLEAIEVMRETMPKVMLVDMEMPRMNGLELTSHVRSQPETEKMPIFMITSRTTEKHREQARTAGVTEYLTKPYQDTELLELIDKALAGRL